MNARRIRAIVRKEIWEYRRNRSVLVAVAIFPLIFLAQPIALLLTLPPTVATQLSHQHLLLYMLAIPVLAPGVLAAYSVAGERLQGSLEPVLTTPIRSDELLVAKAIAAILPSVAISYLVYAIFLGYVVAFVEPGIASALLRGEDMVAQVLLTPLLAGIPTWLGVAISTRAGEPRVAQQLTLLASIPLAVLTSLVAFNVLPASVGLLLVFGAALLLVDLVGWRLVLPMFDRERLIAGSR